MASNICECGMVIRTNTAIHLRGKTHEIRMKHKDIINSEDKITCDKCNISVGFLAYDKHLESKTHIIDNKDNIICDCGKTVKAVNYDRHCNSIDHNNYIKISNNNILKEEIYNENKDINMCCCVCKAIKLDSKYYVKELNLCICCDEILKGGQKKCSMCKELFDIDMFERPYLLKCKKCAAERAKKVIKCECGMNITIGSQSYHRRSAEHAIRLNNKYNIKIYSSEEEDDY